jgi:Fic family protein
LQDDALSEARDLLRDIRDLLVPVSDAYRPQYERRTAIRDLLSTERRKKAWALASGEFTQREIAKAAGMNEGAASRFFKDLRRLGALSDAPNPKRIVEI